MAYPFHCFGNAVGGPALNMEDTTFRFWRRAFCTHWHRGNIPFPPGNDPDGSKWLLNTLDGNPNTYKQWAEENFDKDVAMELIDHVYRFKLISDELLSGFSAGVSVHDLRVDLEEIAYPYIDAQPSQQLTLLP